MTRQIAFDFTTPATGTPPPAAPIAYDELDEAIETLAQTSLEWIIRRLISSDTADLLRRLKSDPVMDKREALSLKELTKNRLVSFEYGKKTARATIHRERIIELAAETDKRIDAWKAGEIGTKERAAA